MTLPSIVLGFVIAALIGSVFHLWRGGGPFRLLLYMGLSLLGFWIGHLVADRIAWTFWSVGQLHLGMAIFGSIATLAFGYWLSLIQGTMPASDSKKGRK